MPSDAQIQAWKKEHNEIHKITPDPERPEIFCIVRHPKMNDIIMSSELGGSDEIEIGRIQLESCWLAGDETIKTNFELLKAAALKMGGVFRVYGTQVMFLELTQDLLTKIPKEKHDRVLPDGEIRKLIVIVDGVEKSALLARPNLLDTNKAKTAKNVVEQGTIYLQECWLSGDEELKSGNDEIRFSAYLAALGLIRSFAAKVEKL